MRTSLIVILLLLLINQIVVTERLKRDVIIRYEVPQQLNMDESTYTLPSIATSSTLGNAQ